MRFGRVWVLAGLVGMSCLASGQQQRKVIIDQDAAGPGGTDQQAILMLIQSPQTEVLGITVVTGDAWLSRRWRTPCARWNSSDELTSRCWLGRSIRW